MSMPSPPKPEKASEATDARLTAEEVDFEAVARVSTQVKLSAVRLSMTHGALHVDPADIPDDWPEQAIVGFDSTATVDPKNHRLLAQCSFLALYAPGIEQPIDADTFVPEEVDPAVDVTARFDLLYELRDASRLREHDAEHFALVNSTLHAWPYWRELAHSLTGRMGISPLVVATLKVPSRHDPPPDQEAVPPSPGGD